ncbi:hypothetical protein DJ021_04725 [Phenylobacterium hankyongense]|uniref:DUF4164 domain-containing protein n=1 Tax=Phenylobacterium hankyongense TaxID=1813876 RepID=A0A328AVZ4_9CAUL|nr:DUF4164 family protein [Phenylobacterium hankyongense]RAK59153.1 hypothetical protein DJ021_04725 [Phenylobacterium hankyongense]
MIRDTAGESALDLAAKRLERAVAMLEHRLAERLKTAGAEAGGLFDQDRAKLAAELDQARARERELEAAGAEASAALGRAILEIRAALNDAPPAAEH